jgi:hypothetical protein
VRNSDVCYVLKVVEDVLVLWVIGQGLRCRRLGTSGLELVAINYKSAKA